MRFCVAVVMGLLVILSSSVAADEETTTTVMPAAITAAAASQRVDFESAMSVAERPLRRPIVLPGLYAGFITLQALDVSYTLRSLPLLAREVNPLMKGVTKYPAAFVALKAGLTIGAIMNAERLWKDDHRVAAIVLMAASNGLMAVVVSRNASTLRQSQ
jgi:Domain of unknown function (DUF5658)